MILDVIREKQITVLKGRMRSQEIRRNRAAFVIATLLLVSGVAGCGNAANSADPETAQSVQTEPAAEKEENSSSAAEKEETAAQEEAAAEVRIDPSHLELLFGINGQDLIDNITYDEYPAGLDMRFDTDHRLVYLTAHSEDMAVYGVQIGGYASDYADALLDAGWMLHSNLLWQKEEDGKEAHAMISTVYEQDDQELVLTGDVTDAASDADTGDVLVTEITLLSCEVVDELAERSQVEQYLDYTKTGVIDLEHPDAKVLSDVEKGLNKYRFSDFYRLMILEGKEDA